MWANRNNYSAEQQCIECQSVLKSTGFKNYLSLFCFIYEIQIIKYEKLCKLWINIQKLNVIGDYFSMTLKSSRFFDFFFFPCTLQRQIKMCKALFLQSMVFICTWFFWSPSSSLLLDLFCEIELHILSKLGGVLGMNVCLEDLGERCTAFWGFYFLYWSNKKPRTEAWVGKISRVFETSSFPYWVEIQAMLGCQV